MAFEVKHFAFSTSDTVLLKTQNTVHKVINSLTYRD